MGAGHRRRSYRRNDDCLLSCLSPFQRIMCGASKLNPFRWLLLTRQAPYRETVPGSIRRFMSEPSHAISQGKVRSVTEVRTGFHPECRCPDHEDAAGMWKRKSSRSAGLSPGAKSARTNLMCTEPNTAVFFSFKPDRSETFKSVSAFL